MPHPTDPAADPVVQAKLASLRRFLASCPPQLAAARLVQYRGVDLLARIDLPLEDVETRVAAAVHEGCSVDWLYRHQLLYLRECDSAEAGPSWQRLFAEQEIDEMKSLLREAGDPPAT